jgi:tight adherence protein B
MLGIVVLFVFAAVFVLALVVLSVLSRALERYEANYAVAGARQLGEMFYFVEPRQLLILNLAVALSLGLVGYVLANWLLALLLAGIGWMAPHMLIRTLRRKRIEKFERQLVDALTQMSAAFKAGLSLPQAVENVSREAGPPLSQEFGLLLKEIKLGVSVEEALTNLSARVESQDLALVVTATNVARQLGGNMAEMFDITAATIRERFRLEGRIRALTSQGKLQGWVVGAMPLALFFVLNWMRPDLMGPFIHSRFGYAVIFSIVLMELCGIYLIRRIVDIDV